MHRLPLSILLFACQFHLFANPCREDLNEQFGPAIVDLDEMAQDFVLETKQIGIPGYPDAFNPSIIRWKDFLLLSFRIYNSPTQVAHRIGLVRLDDEFNPVGSPQILQMPPDDPGCIRKRQDPRLITIGDHLYIAYNNVRKGIPNREIRRMLLAEVHFDGTQFFTLDSEMFTEYEGKIEFRSEKNWVPFEYQNNLLFAYSILPHRIFFPIFGESRCQTISSTRGDIHWDWGELRGGTPAFLVDGEYLAFFHSSCELQSIHSKGKKVQHFFMGAYRFAKEPPFALTQISPQPIFGLNFYHGKSHKTWKPLNIVFPGGFVFDEQFIWIAYGRQDHEVWIAKLDKQGLYNSLILVN